MLAHGMQVRLCRERTTGNIFAMKKLRKDEMLRRGQACPASLHMKSMHLARMLFSMRTSASRIVDALLG